jgi:VWFA-related protein
MKTVRLIVPLVLAFLAVVALPATAQGPVNVSVDGLQLDDFPNARALVTVRNENGVPIGGLEAADFEIVEDGQASFPPAGVATQVNRDETISIVMVIDISGSMDGKPIAEAVRAANALIDQLSPSDRGAVIAFADEVDLDPSHLVEGKEIGFTADKNALRNVVNFLESRIGWDTPLYDAIYKGVRMVAAEPAGKRAVVVMTDGRDERDNSRGVPVPDAGSLSSPDDPINEANRHNIPIFSVGLVGLGGKLNSRYLQRLAERTGGIYQEAPQPEELTPLFENVVDQLKQQYVLDYRSRLEEDAAFHSLLVRVQLPQGQGFDEIKFRIQEEPPATPTPEATATTEPATATEAAPVAEATATSQATAVPEVTPPPPGGTEEAKGSWFQEVLDRFKEQPLLAVVIGAGILLLLALVVALAVVMSRSRRRDEEMATGAYDSMDVPARPTPGWMPGPMGDGTPAGGVPTERGTPGAGADWAAAAAAPPPAAAAGHTVAIRRGPKHLATLVNRARPEQKYDLLQGTTNVGRARTNQIALDDPTVSRHHAWIKADGDTYLLFDVGSSNGTYVNDEQVKDARPLQDGDRVRFGEDEFLFTRVL